ncbi:queuosine precursor transporter [Canibacter sp. lx-45]|uniref:queuosine precursor transporter n=1 Tax=Canibacter zhuwentaonis TaxID=2837491 RepID=UPI001BDC8E17|nr:queuosine precursor transporter [Canibacter zhuwentaonis]MBT1035190.1 queuosine precursor transporter [Canibacter zhuwentaonis]
MSAPIASKPFFAPTRSRVYTVLVAVMVVTLILSNIGASKGVTIWEIPLDGGFFLFPLAYIVGDVLSEVYGFKASRLAVITTFALSIFTALCYWMIITLPPAPWYDGQEALARTLGVVPIIVAASLLAFVIGQLSNAWLMVKLKNRNGEKKLFGRIALSTLLGEFLDTLTFCAIAATAIGINTFQVFLQYLFVGFVFKSIVEIIISPVTIFVINKIKRHERKAVAPTV